MAQMTGSPLCAFDTQAHARLAFAAQQRRRAVSSGQILFVVATTARTSCARRVERLLRIGREMKSPARASRCFRRFHLVARDLHEALLAAT